VIKDNDEDLTYSVTFSAIALVKLSQMRTRDWITIVYHLHADKCEQERIAASKVKDLWRRHSALIPRVKLLSNSPKAT
jgi:hypothetical protein